MSFYVILRGPLGSGKTTLAERLVQRLNGRVVSIDRLLEAHDLEQWEDDYISERSFLQANGFAIAEAEPWLRRRTPVVFDGNFYWRSVIDDLLQRLPYPHAVLTLRLPLAVCVGRDAGRTPSLGAEATRDVYRKVTSFDYGVPIEASGSVDETLDRILSTLRAAGMFGT